MTSHLGVFTLRDDVTFVGMSLGLGKIPSSSPISSYFSKPKSLYKGRRFEPVGYIEGNFSVPRSMYKGAYFWDMKHVSIA